MKEKSGLIKVHADLVGFWGVRFGKRLLIFTANDKTRRALLGKFLDLLREAQPLVAQASEQQVYQLNFDLLTWTPSCVENKTPTK